MTENVTYDGLVGQSQLLRPIKERTRSYDLVVLRKRLHSSYESPEILYKIERDGLTKRQECYKLVCEESNVIAEEV